MIQLNFIFIQFIYSIEKYRNIEISDLVFKMYNTIFNTNPI